MRLALANSDKRIVAKQHGYARTHWVPSQQFRFPISGAEMQKQPCAFLEAGYQMNCNGTAMSEVLGSRPYGLPL
jgi:hypothetical protein